MIIPDFQVAKSGRRARLAADQLSAEDPRYVRKLSAVEILDRVLKKQSCVTVSLPIVS